MVTALNWTEQGKFDAEAAKGLGLPVQYWSRLQNGETVEYEGKTYTSDMVMGAPRKGLKITYTTDTRPTDKIVKRACEGADLFICEGMYGEQDGRVHRKAREKKHMTMYEAAEIAKEGAAEGNVADTLLTVYDKTRAV